MTLQDRIKALAGLGNRETRRQRREAGGSRGAAGRAVVEAIEPRLLFSADTLPGIFTPPLTGPAQGAPPATSLEVSFGASTIPPVVLKKTLQVVEPSIHLPSNLSPGSPSINLVSVNLSEIAVGLESLQHGPARPAPPHVSLRITNPTGHTVNGNATILLELGAPASIQLSQTTARVHLPPGGAKRVDLSLAPSLPDVAKLSPGTYPITADVFAPDGSVTSSVGPALTVEEPSVKLDVSAVQPPAKPVTAAAVATVRLTATNSGTVASSGTFNLKLSASPQPSGQNATALGVARLHVSLRPGASRALTARVPIPKTLPAGTYYLVAAIDAGPDAGLDAVAGNSGVSASPFTVV